MNRIAKAGSLLLLLSICLADVQKWSSHSAHILPQKHWEMGLFQPFRYGYSESLEYSTHPLWFFVMPNVIFKKKHEDFLKYNMASKWSMYYPTPILNMVARNGIGGFIDPTFQMPPMLGLSLSLLMTKQMVGTELTFSSGFDLGINFGELEERSNIELPLLYHRLGVFQNNYGLHTGIDIEKNITNKTSVFLDFDLSILPGMGIDKSDSGMGKIFGEYAIEHKLLLMHNRSDGFRVITGYKFIYGKYPFGEESRLLPFVPLLDLWVPMIELQWSGLRK